MTARQLAILGAGFATVFAACAIVVGTGRSHIDLDVATWVAAHRDPGWTDFFIVISYLGSVVGLVPLGLLVALYLKRRMGWPPVRWLALAMIGATAIYAFLNVMYASERPPPELRVMDSDGYSFPSGHSTQTVAFWITTAVLASADRAPRTGKLLRAIALVLVVLTASSRIYLGVHWTFDVMGGLSLGAAWTCCVLALRART